MVVESKLAHDCPMSNSAAYRAVHGIPDEDANAGTSVPTGLTVMPANDGFTPVTYRGGGRGRARGVSASAVAVVMFVGATTMAVTTATPTTDLCYPARDAASLCTTIRMQPLYYAVQYPCFPLLECNKSCLLF
jgi:hypothetical protein